MCVFPAAVHTWRAEIYPIREGEECGNSSSDSSLRFSLADAFSVGAILPCEGAKSPSRWMKKSDILDT